jgi:hypothetical protein
MSFENPIDPARENLPPVLEVPVLAIRNTVIFPVLAFPINVGPQRVARSEGGRDGAGQRKDKYLLGIFAQRDPKTEDPAPRPSCTRSAPS